MDIPSIYDKFSPRLDWPHLIEEVDAQRVETGYEHVEPEVELASINQQRLVQVPAAKCEVEAHNLAEVEAHSLCDVVKKKKTSECEVEEHSF